MASPATNCAKLPLASRSVCRGAPPNHAAVEPGNPDPTRPALYQVYRDNYGVLMAFHRDELEVPQELQVAAEIAISQRALTALQLLERETSDFPFSQSAVVPEPNAGARGDRP